MKKAFTLIELLVVIAIIAILAAILFPVFAQAKLAAKKTQTLSNVKQMGTGVAIYLSDSDDSFPIAWSIRTAGTYRWATVHPTPNGSIGSGWDSDTVKREVSAQWANSIQPYIKSWGLYSSPTTTAVTLPGEVFSTLAGAPKAENINLMMNGLMSEFNASAVASPSLVPLLWTGMGNTSFKGRSAADPALQCDGPAVNGSATGCRFNAGGPAQPNSSVASGGGQDAMFTFANFNPSWTVWNYGGGVSDGGAAFVRADTSAKVQRVGTVADPQYHTSATTDPYALVGKYGTSGLGSGFSYWTTSQGDCTDPGNDNGTFQYTCFFRPDRTN